jgi:hypothetical protein
MSEEKIESHAANLTHLIPELPVHPATILHRNLIEICENSISEYLEQYESCCFKFNGDANASCVRRPESKHDGHASATGQSASGTFQRKQEWKNGHKTFWLKTMQDKYCDMYLQLSIHAQERGQTDDLPPMGQGFTMSSKLKTLRESTNAKYVDVWSSIRSNKTCMSCLQAVPDHVLACGHSYCPRCIQELGNVWPDRECTWSLKQCPLCLNRPGGPVRHFIQLKPLCAGARVLSLDGGGVRGIVELTTLLCLEEFMGVDIPIGDYFDLVLGTSTGKLIFLYPKDAFKSKLMIPNRRNCCPSNNNVQ